MKNKLNIITIYLLTFSLSFLCSCKKEDGFLDAKPNQALAVPTNLTDLQNLLNDENVFNRSADPTLGEITSDDFYTQDSALPSLSLSLERNAYSWQKTIYDISYTQIPDWNAPYLMVYYANTVLDALPKLISTANPQTADQIRGAALFYRAYAFYNLVQTFSLPYNDNTATTSPGIPIRLTADANDKPQRSSVADCYKQIFADLQAAVKLLPVTVTRKTQPCQAAANALLARINLAIGKYPDALIYANASLNHYNVLNDYNKLTTPTSTGINNAFLNEDIYHATMVNYSIISNRRYSYVDPSFIALYDNNDLRKTKFFTVLDALPAFPRFVGSYDFKNLKFSGLATDELYLIKAECLARSGDVTNAMITLNTLLINRWKTATFVPLTAVSQDDSIIKILLERRKELLYRGLRWTDLRRLNNDPKYATQISRVINGTTNKLPPNDPRYAMPIPDNEITLGGLIQNQR